MTENDKSIDALGLKSFGEATKIATQGVVNGAAAFFGRICLPAAEEFGLLLRDKVHAFRTANVAAMAQTAERLLDTNNVHASPRLVATVVEEASWIDDQYLRDMWAGLLASSCTEDGDDDSNLMFLDILAKLTKLQGRLIAYICDQAPKFTTPNGLPFAKEIHLNVNTLKVITECDDLERIDRELDHLRALELIDGGFQVGPGHASQDAEVTATAIAMHMYVRCQGSRKSPVEYFGLNVDPAYLPNEAAVPEETEK